MPEKVQESLKKIILTGLAAAGKTSIIRALDQDFLGLHQLTPTKGVEHSKIKIFGVEIFRWDFGGQEMYREKYIEEKERYFVGTNLIVYVLDIQDANVQANLDYLHEVFQAIKALALKPLFAVFFHKYDPRILLASTLHRERMDNFINSINGMKGDIDVWYYPTSIYDLPSLITSFSHIFLQIFPQQEILAKELGAIRERLTTPALAISDMSPFVISRSYAPGMGEEETRQFEARMLAMTRLLKNRSRSTTAVSWEVEPYSEDISVVAFSFPVKTEQFVLTGLFGKGLFQNADKVRDFDTHTKDAVLGLRKILEHFFV